MKSIKTRKDTKVEIVKSPERMRQIMELAGFKIGNVHFIKRSNGKLRKMSYRLHVHNPKYIDSPSGNSNRKMQDKQNDTITVYSTNDIIKNKRGRVIGRGAYKTIPLDGIVRVVAGGKVYKIKKAW